MSATMRFSGQSLDEDVSAGRSKFEVLGSGSRDWRYLTENITIAVISFK